MTKAIRQVLELCSNIPRCPNANNVPDGAVTCDAAACHGSDACAITAREAIHLFLFSSIGYFEIEASSLRAANQWHRVKHLIAEQNVLLSEIRGVVSNFRETANSREALRGIANYSGNLHDHVETVSDTMDLLADLSAEAAASSSSPMPIPHAHSAPGIPFNSEHVARPF